VAYEGTPGPDRHNPSVFTEAVVLGLRTGDADVDGDGIVSPADLWRFVTDSMSTTVPRQTPVLMTDGLEGVWTVATNPNGSSTPVDRPKPTPASEVAGLNAASHAASVLSESMESVLDRIEALSNRDHLTDLLPDTVSSGLDVLDEVTGGFQLGELILVTGPPGSGRSTLALQVARSASIRNNYVSLLVTFELSEYETITRLLAAESRIPVNHLVNGTMTDDDWQRLARTMGTVTGAPIFIQDGLEGSIEAECSALAARHPLRLVVVDDLQLMTNPREPADLLTATRALKLMARRLGVVVVAGIASAPSLATEFSPIGQIDRYADLVIEIDRPDLVDYYTERAGEADFHIVRNRRRARMTVTAAFQAHYARFVDMAEPSKKG
jgi:replicative DNA helicase